MTNSSQACYFENIMQAYYDHYGNMQARSIEWMQPCLWAACSKLGRPANIITVRYAERQRKSYHNKHNIQTEVTHLTRFVELSLNFDFCNVKHSRLHQDQSLVQITH